MGKRHFRKGNSTWVVLAVAVSGLACSVRTGTGNTASASSSLIINVPQGGDLQGAIDKANLGDEIRLDSGASYGPITLPNKSGGSGYITITVDPKNLPAEGTRIDPSYASVLAKITCPDYGSAILTAPGAHHFKFRGIEFPPPPKYAYDLIYLEAQGGQNSLSQVPHHLIFEQVYAHTSASIAVRRAFLLNSAATEINDSYVAGYHDPGSDSQAIGGTNGPGPFKIVNNYLEGASENVLFGGEDPIIPNLIPSDIDFEKNYVRKDPSWPQHGWNVKNLLELKNAQRVTINGNVFENNWADGQAGTGILFTVRNQNHGCPWCTVQKVWFTNNSVRHVGGGVAILGTDDQPNVQSTEADTLNIVNNLFEDVNGSLPCLQVASGKNITYNHNDCFETYDIVSAYVVANPATNFVFTNNIVNYGEYGNHFEPSMDATMPGAVFKGNLVVDPPAQYVSFPSAGNFFSSKSQLGFVDFGKSNYRLTTSSSYHNASIDNPATDIGVDFDALQRAQSAQSGTPAASAPTVAITAPADGAGVSGKVALSASASASSPNTVTSVVFNLNGTPIPGATVKLSPYGFSWDSRSVSDEKYQLSATVTDSAGNVVTSQTISVTVGNTPVPAASVSVTAPADADFISGRAVAFSASSSLAKGRVEFDVDGASVGTVSAPYHFNFDSTTVADGPHTIVAKAFDVSGKLLATSSTISVTVNNTITRGIAVSLTAPGNGTTVSGSSVPVSVSAEDLSKSALTLAALYVDNTLVYSKNTPPFSFTLDSSALANGAHSLFARVYDSAGNVGSSPVMSITVNNPSLRSSVPLVALLTPENGATVSGSITFTASVSSENGIRDVEFDYDGIAIAGAGGGNAGTKSYTLQWDTTRLANGDHTLRARAIDANGSVGTSASVEVTVKNASGQASSPLETSSVAQTTGCQATGSMDLSLWLPAALLGLLRRRRGEGRG